jgi:hypothetical protein
MSNLPPNVWINENWIHTSGVNPEWKIPSLGNIMEKPWIEEILESVRSFCAPSFLATINEDWTPLQSE